jgi:hypothetical protein
VISERLVFYTKISTGYTEAFPYIFGVMPYPNEASGLLEPPISPKMTCNTIKANDLTALFEQPVSYDLIREEVESYDIEEDEEEESHCPKLKCQPINIKSTIIGSLVFLLYHIVFCLAQAATITRPHANHSSTGIMAKTAALGIFTAGPCCKSTLHFDHYEYVQSPLCS